MIDYCAYMQEDDYKAKYYDLLEKAGRIIEHCEHGYGLECHDCAYCVHIEPNLEEK